MEKLLFIASFQYGEPPTGGGAQAKNQLLLAHLQKYYDVRFFDTWNKSSAVSLLSAIFYIIVFNRKCVLSISGRGALSIGKLLSFLHIRRLIIYFVIGGDLGNYVEEHQLCVPVLKSFRWILVEGQYMKSQLNELGIENVNVLPNFKPIGNLLKKKNNESGFIKFVFLGRLIEEKGVGLLIDASRKLYEEYGKKFSVTFYGSQTNTYSQGYFDTLDCDNISYGGFLNLKSKEGLKQLSEYDVMVFPTYFEGEGFPGVLIDAFKAGLPVIASDFHANPDVISNPALGVLIKPKDVDSLKSAMLGFIENPSRIPSMSMAVQKDVCKYDIDKVLNKENINRIFEK
ncbi:MAG: glycosyltransferase [Escherichia coli]|nr:glycosyltransferase [Escherichia coli]